MTGPVFRLVAKVNQQLIYSCNGHVPSYVPFLGDVANGVAVAATDDARLGAFGLAMTASMFSSCRKQDEWSTDSVSPQLKHAWSPERLLPAP